MKIPNDLTTTASTHIVSTYKTLESLNSKYKNYIMENKYNGISKSVHFDKPFSVKNCPTSRNSEIGNKVSFESFDIVARINSTRNKINLSKLQPLLINPHPPISLKNLQCQFKNYAKAKSSKKKYGIIKSYAVNTYHGIVRNYNEDRVAIILNITPTISFTGKWPRCSMFAVFDGHGGNKCADYLRDNLFDFITKDINFPYKPEQAIKNAFFLAEKEFTKTIALDTDMNLIDSSGSCVNLILFVNEMCYVANLGDSRAIMSKYNGQQVIPLSIDHKPDNPVEYERIYKNGGSVYQTNVKKEENRPGPYRLLPGKLSVNKI